MIHPVPARAPVDFAAMDRAIARAAHPLFLSRRRLDYDKYSIMPPHHHFRPVPDAAEALRRIVELGQVELQDGRFFLTIELTEALEAFLATFDAAAEDLEDDDPAEANGDERDTSAEYAWHGGST